MGKVYPELEPENFDENRSRSCPDLYTKHRKPTDVCFFTVFATFFVVLFCFIGYCMYFGDINRIIHGYDSCGTVCGKEAKVNLNDPQIKKCHSFYDTKPFGPYGLVIEDKITVYRKICAKSCSDYPDYFKFFHRCLPNKTDTASLTDNVKHFFVTLAEDFELYWQELIYLCVLSLVVSLVILLFFRICVDFIVWIILIGVQVASIFAACALWVIWANKGHFQNKYTTKESMFYLGYAIAATILSVVVALVIFFMRKKIELVIQLFKEAGKAIGSMPGLLLEPILTFFAFAATIFFGIYFFLWINSAGHLEPRETVFHYRKDGWMKAAAVLNIIGMMWMYQFIIGCQHMIVAGAVSKWYFTRDKSHLSSPIIQSAYNLTRYHLGSVAVGSFLLTAIQILKIIVSTLRKMLEKEHNTYLICVTKACLCLCSCILSCMETIVHIFTGNAYIIVAMYGYPFFKAGKKGFANIVEHPFSIAAINSVGDFVLFLGKVLVVVVTEMTAVYLLKDKGLEYLNIAMVVIGLFSFCIAHCFITVYEMIIDTVFMCFCEDSKLNDGLSKPYYMSKGLMEFVDNSKKALEAYDQRKLYGHQESRLTGKRFVNQPINSMPLEEKSEHI